jgi:putative membrane protein
MMGWYSGGMGYGAWMFMGLFWLVLIGLIIWAAARLLPTSHDGVRNMDSPQEILDHRFARGEIDGETYRAQRAELSAARGEHAGDGR